LVYLGVALTALATLVLELSLTRIFSVVFQYHFAFLAISMALFGLGAGGLFSYAFCGRGSRVFGKLGVLAAVNSVCVVGSLAFLLSREGSGDGGPSFLIYLTSALPFFLAGTVLATAVAEAVARVNRIYLFDLLGAAGGCFLLVPLLNYLGGPNTVIGAAVLYAASAAIWFTLAGSRRGRALAVMAALGLVMVVVINAKHAVIDVRFAKGEALNGERFVKWNSFSRIAVEPAETGRMGIQIDAEPAGYIASVDLERLSEDGRRALLQQGPGVAYLLRPGAKTLILNAGGGEEVARALASGSRNVTGVEINPIIANTIMREKFSAASQRLYFRPEVRIVIQDGRSFVSQTQERYQVLQVAPAQTRASTVAGAAALAENHLLTTEAFQSYLERLTDDGLLTLTRPGLDPPHESLRLAAVTAVALDRLGEREPWRHVLVVRDKADDTVVVSRRPFAAGDLEQFRLITAGGTMKALYIPGGDTGGMFARLLRGLDGDSVDVPAVNDNRPYLFHPLTARDLWTAASDGEPLVPAADPARLLVRLAALSMAAAAIVLAFPPLVLGSRLPAKRRVLRFLFYFVFIGAGYILIEVALIQKFGLFLGHPTYALTVIVFALLVSSGAGSYHSGRVIASSDRSLVAVLAVVALLVAALSMLIAPLVAFGGGWPLWLKVALTLLLIAPAGFLMGMPMPAGLARLEKHSPPSVRWAWSLNAAASVMGSALAMLLSVQLGLRETLLFGGVMYLGALLAVQWRGRDVGQAAAA
jgi:hypothetical protein